ncbi:MAG TPA: type II toxin-antitoxin system RelE/ParE family toxin [Pirellulaceae bacterium]|nr:type II toxin-antitoxin system RelE/ParE family toxin [Pirellulaceae bacterium]
MSSHYTSLAEIDLCHIWLHIAEHSAAGADRVLGRLMNTCDLLALNSGLGQTCEEYGKRIRRFSKDKYVIYFRPIEDGIEVTRILHGSQDPDIAFGIRP